MDIRAEVLGEKLVYRRLTDIGRRADDMRPALREVARFWMDTEKELFESSGGSAGRPWDPTKAGNKPLIDTGRLMDSLTQQGHGDQILEVGLDWMVFGTAREGARFHQTGAPNAHLPVRRPLDLGPAQRRQTVKILQRFIVTGEVGRSR